MKVGAVIVAAGLSSRMGKFKPMLPLGVRSLAQQIIATLQAAAVSPIVVVTGHHAEQLERHLSGSGVTFLRNEHYQTTEMFDSAKIGLSFLENECDFTLFTPVDIPLFTPGSIRRLLCSRADLTQPVYHNTAGHPIMMSRSVVQKILSDCGPGGLKGALVRCGIPETRIEVEDEGILYDANTTEEYQFLLRYYKTHQSGISDRT